MTVTSDQLFEGLSQIGTEFEPETIPADVIAKLVECGIVQEGTSPPQFTEYGWKCYSIFENGEGYIPILDDMAAVENEEKKRLGLNLNRPLPQSTLDARD